MHEGVWFRKNIFWQNDSCENLDNFSLIRLLYMHREGFKGRSTPTTAFDGTIWYFAFTMLTHWTYAWRSSVQKTKKLTKWQQWELRQFSLMRCLYMHGWCLHGPNNSYHSLWWSNLIPCLYNVDTLNKCMKEFGSEMIIFVQNDSCENLHNSYTIFP